MQMGRQSAEAQRCKTQETIKGTAYAPRSRTHSIASTSPHSIGRLSIQEDLPRYGTSRQTLLRSPSIHIPAVLAWTSAHATISSPPPTLLSSSAAQRL